MAKVTGGFAGVQEAGGDHAGTCGAVVEGRRAVVAARGFIFGLQGNAKFERVRSQPEWWAKPFRTGRTATWRYRAEARDGGMKALGLRQDEMDMLTWGRGSCPIANLNSRGWM